MRTRTQIRLLYFLAAAISVSGVLILAVQFFAKVESPFKTAILPAKDVQQVRNESINVTLKDFEPLWDKRLQGKPVTPPVKEVVVAEKPKPVPAPQVQLPNFSLTGILHSNSFSLATFEVGGKSIACAVGEEIEGARVEMIEPDEVTLVYREKKFVRGLE